MDSVELLKKLIAFRSLTPDDDGAFAFIKEYMSSWEQVSIDKEGVKNLLLFRKNGDGIHLCLAGHIDVVPAGEGWESDPFVASLENGYIFGRGAADMKAGVAAILNAAKVCCDFKGTISVLLTSDEEGDAFYGTVEALKWMKEQNLLPDICLITEPTCEKKLGDTVKLGRRGSVNGVVKIIGRGGHSAYPEKAINPIYIASNLLSYLGNARLDDGDEHFSPSVLVVTDIRGGYKKHNVIPTEVEIMFNVRNSTKTSRDDIEEFVKRKLSSAGCDSYELTVTESARPFATRGGKHAKLIADTLKEAVTEVTGVEPKFSTSGGTSDARFMAEFGVAVIEFGVPNDTIHAPNERVLAEDVLKLQQVCERFIEMLQQRAGQHH